MSNYDNTVEDFRHKGWLIQHATGDKFEATHPDFEGPYDERFVIGNSPEEARQLVDEWITENMIRDFQRNG